MELSAALKPEEGKISVAENYRDNPLSLPLIYLWTKENNISKSELLEAVKWDLMYAGTAVTRVGLSKEAVDILCSDDIESIRNYFRLKGYLYTDNRLIFSKDEILYNVSPYKVIRYSPEYLAGDPFDPGDDWEDRIQNYSIMISDNGIKNTEFSLFSFDLIGIYDSVAHSAQFPDFYDWFDPDYDFISTDPKYYQGAIELIGVVE